MKGGTIFFFFFFSTIVSWDCHNSGNDSKEDTPYPFDVFTGPTNCYLLLTTTSTLLNHA